MQKKNAFFSNGEANKDNYLCFKVAENVIMTDTESEKREASRFCLN